MEYLDARLTNVESRVHALEVYQEHCETRHHNHSTKDELQSLSVAKQLELINRTIDAQNSMSISIKNLSDTIASIISFMSNNKETLESIASLLTGLRGLKKVILGTAAIVAALGVLLGASLATWSIFSAPSILEALISIRNIQ